MVRDWIRLACYWPVVRRALKYTIVVGAVLILIKHGDAIVRGEVDGVRIMKMGLTVLVPYIVSALSSVGAMKEVQGHEGSFSAENLAAKKASPNSGIIGDTPMVVFSTTFGDFTIELYPERAPVTVENFLAYVDAGFYSGTIFHRIVPGFVIQGGGFNERMEQKPTRPPIKNEADNGLKNERSTISMARTQDVNSATSQYFINLQNNAVLDHGSRDFGYAVFGRVIEGMDTVDKIAAVPTSTRGRHQNVPLDPVVIQSARRK
jgi:peptidyl-prolyl cis-trans isomerase A (cyclophilin A)